MFQTANQSYGLFPWFLASLGPHIATAMTKGPYIFRLRVTTRFQTKIVLRRKSPSWAAGKTSKGYARPGKNLNEGFTIGRKVDSSTNIYSRKTVEETWNKHSNSYTHGEREVSWMTNFVFFWQHDGPKEQKNWRDWRVNQSCTSPWTIHLKVIFHYHN